MTKKQYFNQYFAIHQDKIINVFAGDGKKHSALDDEQFLHKSAFYHFCKAMKHMFRGILFGCDPDSGYHHFYHMILRLLMCLHRMREMKCGMW